MSTLKKPVIKSTSMAASSTDPSTPSSEMQQPQAESSQSGKISRMRQHKGNMPSLPQTKLCPLCSAKFTRTTHLNRHLRTHSNERLHECDRCNTQFTRSDLLTRHKRSCGDPANAGRSRRKSCQACADSKVKCDLQRPCSKCVSRKRECVYVTGPNAPTQNASHEPADGASVVISEESRASCSPASSYDSQHSAPTPPDQSSSDAQSAPPLSTSPSLPVVHEIPENDSSVPPSSIPPSSTTWSVFNYLQNSDSLVRSRPGGKAPVQSQEHAEDFIPNELFGDLVFSNIFPAQADWQASFSSADMDPSESPSSMANPQATSTQGVGTPHTSQLDTTFLFLLDSEWSTRPDSVDSDVFSVGMSMGDLTNNASGQVQAPLRASGTLSSSIPEASVEEHSASELQHYLNLFFHAYHPNMPMVHLPTFDLAGKPPILLTAMRACGALYVRTRIATDYIDSILASSRDELVAEFAKKPTDYEQQMYLVLAAVLLQTIGLFHGRPKQRAASTVYHGMLMMLVWMSGFVQSTASWQPPPMDNCASAGHAWREWALHEMAKRALVVCYLHDCVHCMYFNLRPTFPSNEFNIGLPCEDVLWTARCPKEWMDRLGQPSLYGGLTERLCGIYLQDIYAKLAMPDPAFNPILMQTSWAQQVTIHAIIRKLFEDYLEERLPELDAQKDAAPNPLLPPVSQERIYILQLMLHRWLQSWLQSPETAHSVPDREAPFMFNPLPFYWFAQVAVLAYQEGLPPFDASGTFLRSDEAKFRLMKRWERHIRAFVRKGEQQPMLTWDELMAIRLQSWRVVLASGGERDNADANLMGFFPDT